MKLKVNTKALIASTVALAVIPFTKATAETLEDWVARSVDEIKHDIQSSSVSAVAFVKGITARATVEAIKAFVLTFNFIFYPLFSLFFCSRFSWTN